MLKKTALAFCVLLALSGCSSKKGYYSDSTSATELDFKTEIGDRVYFSFDTDHLTAGAKAELDRQVNWLNSDSNNQIYFVLEGHADERGTREYNLALGERRANAVKRYMVMKGVDESRVEVISYGKERPAAIGDTPEIHKLNRRVVTNLK